MQTMILGRTGFTVTKPAFGALPIQRRSKEDAVAILRLVNPATPLRFAGGRRDMADATAAKAVYVGISAGIAGPLLTTPGADYDDDRHLAVKAGYAVAKL